MFHRMDKIELQILSIKKLKMVHIYDLSGKSLAGINSAEPRIAGIAVTADDGMQLNLCEMDPFFDLLVNKVYELYRQSPDIFLGDSTKALLEAGFKSHGDSFVSAYYSLEGKSDPLVPVDSSLSRRFTDFAAYLIESLYKAMDIQFTPGGCKTGWRGATVIYGTVGQEKKIFSYRVVRATNTFYTFRIGSFPEADNYLDVRLNLCCNRILVTFADGKGAFNGSGLYEFGTGSGSESYSVRFNDDKVFEGSRTLERIAPGDLNSSLMPLAPGLKDADAASRTVIYKLPFGIYSCLGSSSSEEERILSTDYVCTLIYPNAGYSSTQHWTGIRNLNSGLLLKVNTCFIEQLMLSGHRIQTYFAQGMGNSCTGYREKLENLYFIERTDNKQ